MLNKIAHMGLNRLSKGSLFSAVGLPSIILEIGHTQGKLVQEKLDSLGYQSIKIGQDLQKKIEPFLPTFSLLFSLDNLFTPAIFENLFFCFS